MTKEETCVNSAVRVLGSLALLGAVLKVTFWVCYINFILGALVLIAYAAYLFITAEKLRGSKEEPESCRLPWYFRQPCSLWLIAGALDLCVRTVFPKGSTAGSIIGVHIPYLLLSAAVWFLYGQSSIVMSLNIYLGIIVLLSQYAGIAWIEIASLVTLAVTAFMKIFQPDALIKILKEEDAALSNAQAVMSVAVVTLQVPIYFFNFFDMKPMGPNWLRFLCWAVLLLVVGGFVESRTVLATGMIALVLYLIHFEGIIAHLFPEKTNIQIPVMAIYWVLLAIAFKFLAPPAGKMLLDLSTKARTSLKNTQRAKEPLLG